MSEGRAERGRSELRVESRLIRLNHILHFAQICTSFRPSSHLLIGPQLPLSEPDQKSSITFSSEDFLGVFLAHQRYRKMRQMRTTLPRPTTGCRKISDDCTFHFLIENDHTRGVVAPAFAAIRWLMVVVWRLSTA